MDTFCIPQTEGTRIRAELLDAIAPTHGNPLVVHAMAGIPGAGKSTFVQRAQAAGLFPIAAFILDPDRVMTALRVYHQDVAVLGAEAAFKRWEMPCRELAYTLARDAAARGLPIIKDMAMARPENWQMLRNFKTLGYRIDLHVIACPVDTAVRAAAKRARHFPPDQIVARAAALDKLLEEYADVPNRKFCYERTENDFIRTGHRQRPV